LNLIKYESLVIAGIEIDPVMSKITGLGVVKFLILILNEAEVVVDGLNKLKTILYW
jgi:hypothetical protein